MFENIYTTKMSADKKSLQRRFSKIRSKNGRISRVFSLIMIVLIASTMLYATVVMAIMNEQETEQMGNEDKIQGTNITYSQQNINESELYKIDTSNISLQQPASYDKTSENNLTNDNIEKQSIDLSRNSVVDNANNHSINTDIAQTITDEKKIKSSSVSDKLYVGFEQIDLSNINTTEIQKELQDNGITQMTWDTSSTNINRLAQTFASQYPYKEGDTEKSFDLYPNIIYTSGMEKTADGVEYECPAIYDDSHAYEWVNQIQVTPAKFVIDSSSYEVQYATFKSKLLVPYYVFKLLGCKVLIDKNSYVATISKNDTTLEIIPNIIGMRKNQADGYWVPLEICARVINDTLYIPLEAVSKEFGYTTKINLDSNIIGLYERQ